jgi:hypothetical protein
MSLKRGENVNDYLYIGLAERTIPLPGQKKASGLIYTVTRDHIEIYRAPFITLDVGVTYHFVIDTPGHPFYITTDDKGGGVQLEPVQSMIGAIQITPETTQELGNVGITKGTLKWTPNRDHNQMTLFYQCDYHPSMGNTIHVRFSE